MKVLNESKIMGVEGHEFLSVKCPSCGDWYNSAFMTKYCVQGGDPVLLCKHCLAAHEFAYNSVQYSRCECGKYVNDNDCADMDGIAECCECKQVNSD